MMIVLRILFILITPMFCTDYQRSLSIKRPKISVRLQRSQISVSSSDAENLDDRALHPQDRRFHFNAGGAGDQVGCRCSVAAGLKTIPAVQQRCVREIAGRKQD